MSQAPSLTCVLPCLNERANLDVLLPELMTVLDSLTSAYEIIIVDDGSSDGTADSVAEWSRRYPQIVHLQLSRNFGKESALMAGLQNSRGQVVVCMDADLQHPPALIAAMLDRWQDGVEMVYAVRSTRADETRFKRWGTALFYKLLRTTSGLHIPEDACDFRLMDRAVVDALLLMPERNLFMKGLFAWVGFRAEPIAYTPQVRLHGHTAFRPFKLVRLAVDGITAFTTWPLRVLSVMGACLSLLSFSYGIFIVATHWFFGDPVQGWATLITVVLFFAGVQLISLGVVGEYIARIFSEVKHRPLYVIRRRAGQGLSAARMERQPVVGIHPGWPRKGVK